MKLDTLPDWPRCMRAELAAAYVGESVSTFLDRVKLGHYPKPMTEPDARRIVRWDRAEMDRWLDRLTGRRGGFIDPDEALEKFHEDRAADARGRHR